MVRGKDAADVAMITSFGNYDLTYFRVWTDPVSDESTDQQLLDSLRTRPAGEALVLGQSSGRLRI